MAKRYAARANVGVREIEIRVRQAEIVSGVSPHDLRRTHASLAAESGMSLQIIQQCLGHSSARTAERHYVFIRNNVVTDAVKQFPTLPLPGERHGAAAATP